LPTGDKTPFVALTFAAKYSPYKNVISCPFRYRNKLCNHNATCRVGVITKSIKLRKTQIIYFYYEERSQLQSNLTVPSSIRATNTKLDTKMCKHKCNTQDVILLNQTL